MAVPVYIPTNNIGGFPFFSTPSPASFADFNFLPLSLIFAILITLCLGMIIFGLLFWVLYFLVLVVYFLSQVRAVFSYYIIKYVLFPFLSLFSIWEPYNVNVSTLDVISQRFLNCPHFLNSFFFFLFNFSYFHYSAFQFTDPFLCII